MRCSPSNPDRAGACDGAAWLRFWLLVLACFGAFIGMPACAGSITANRAALTFDEDGASLAADFSISLGERLEDTLQHGIALAFKLELVLDRPREYWVAEHIATRVWRYRLSYSSLTRQYRVAFGKLQRDYATIDEALSAIGRAAALPVIDAPSVRPATTYNVALRLSLDRSQLPKPFQLDALTNAEWQVDTATLNWQVKSP